MKAAYLLLVGLFLSPLFLACDKEDHELKDTGVPAIGTTISIDTAFADTTHINF
jgi:hypothetical protein